MCHRWLLGFVVNSVGSSLVFFGYVGWICGLVIWCHFGENRKDVPKNTQDLANWPRRLRRLSLALMAEVGKLPMECRAIRIACWLILAGRFSCMPSLGTFSLWGSQVTMSCHHTPRGCYSTHPNWLQIATQATSESSPFLLVGKELLQYVHA